MASRTDSLQDIFGPSDPVDGETPSGPEASTASIAPPETNLDFDDIFSTGDNAASQPAQPPPPPSAQGSAGPEIPEDSSLPPAAGGESGASTGGTSPADLENLFGDAPPNPSGDAALEESYSGGGLQDDADTASGSREGGSAESGAVAAGRDAAGDKEFLDFLYEDDGKTKTAAAAAAQVQGGPASAASTNLSCSPPAQDGEEASFLGSAPAAPARGMEPAAAWSSPASELDSIPLGSPPLSIGGASADDDGEEGDGTNAPPPLPPTAAAAAAAGAATESFARKERQEVLRPLPKDPGTTLRDLVFPEDAASGASGDASDDIAGKASEGTLAAELPPAADDIGYVRRLCAATGGFLTADLRPVVWSLLLGLGRKPEDAGFRKWRDERGGNPALVAAAATAAYKIDLRNDCLALARRLCEVGSGEVGNGGASAAAEAEAEAGGDGDAGRDPEALAVDIEEVLTFYCTRRSEAYEPVLCALVGPLFSMGLDPSAVSAMLYPLVGSLTLFLGRGLTHAVRDLAWGHAHHRLHDLCTYHDPELVQHLDRCFPGWEMPLPAASVSRAETSALDQEAAAMVDDLESSLAASLPKRRSLSKGTSLNRAASVDGEGAGGRAERAAGQGLVEPSLLVAANAGLGASAPLRCLLPLWDYLLVRHDKHFGFFFVLAALLRGRDELLAATGPHLRSILAEALSPADMATHLDAEGFETGQAKGGSTSALVSWCNEAETLDLATPESFRHHLALIGEIAEAEHEAAVRTRARKDADGSANGAGPPAAVNVAAATVGQVEAAAEKEAVSGGQAEADLAAAKGLNHPSLLRMRSMMKNAGDKLAADLKNIKLARSTSGSRENTEDLAAPIELSLPQLCLAVSAKELVMRVSRTGPGRLEVGDVEEEAVEGERGGEGEGEGEVKLFRERQPLSFFAVDCRPKEQVEAGRFPTAFHLDPSAMDNPEEMAETIMPVFEPLRRRAHVCLVGTGDGHIRARGSRARNGGQGSNGKGGEGAVGSQKAARDEYSYVNTCALFFVKRGFPYVSVLEGGFAAAHELAMDTIDRNGGDASLSTAIVDHNPTACRLCLAQKSGSGTASVGGGMGGLLFPLSPPLWARIGAADLSGHGDTAAAAAEKGQGKEAATGGSPFFPHAKAFGSGGAGDTEKASSNDSSASGGEGRADGSDGGGSGGGGGGMNANNFNFKAGAMFRGMNMGMFKGAAPAGTETSEDSSAPAAATAALNTTKSETGGAGDAGKVDTAGDLAAKLRISFGRFGGKDPKKPPGEAGASLDSPPQPPPPPPPAAAGGANRDSGFGSLFRKAQSFKAADVAAAFAELRDGPKTSGASTAVSTPGGGVGVTRVNEVAGVIVEEEDDDEGGGLFVIGDDGSEASEATDSDFEGFDGEHKPPSSGGARTAEDKALALLEHRLSGQVKGATMVVDDFLKVSGAKVFTVTKHKVTYHVIDASPTPASENASTEPETELETATGSQEKETAAVDKQEGVGDDPEASTIEAPAEADGCSDETAPATPAAPPAEVPRAKKLRVRAVTELERVVFLSRERILVLACPSGPRSPGLVKSNHHLTELQKMTFMRRDPTLVTLHYVAPEGGTGEPGAPPATKRNVYRFDLDDKEAFIRIIRGALQRFQA